MYVKCIAWRVWAFKTQLFRLSYFSSAFTRHLELASRISAHSKDLISTHLFVCPLMQFCTFLFEQNDREHSDPAVTPLAPHSWKTANLERCMSIRFIYIYINLIFQIYKLKHIWFNFFKKKLTRFLAELIEESLARIRVITTCQLQEWPRLFPLLHEPKA